MDSLRSRWNDERLDDLANEFRSLRDIPKALAEQTVEMRSVKSDMDALFEQNRELKGEFEEYRKELRQEAEKRRIERKSDMRWIIGTIIAAGGLIIAAVGLLVG
jgi:regulator of replication initiation timing